MGRGPGIRAASESSIQIDFKYKGVRCRERIALAPTPRNLKYAATLKARIQHEIATHTFSYLRHFPESPRARRLSGGAGVPLVRAIRTYCDCLEGQLEPETLKKYRFDGETCAKQFPGKTLDSLTRADVRDWVASLQLSKKRIDNLLTPLRGTFKQALEDEAIDQNPLDGFIVRRVRQTKERLDPFTREEIEALSKTPGGNIWKFWAWTGLRSGELVGLRWDDVDLAAGSLAVRRSVRVGREKATKTAAGCRVVKLLPGAVDALRDQPERVGSGAIFTNPSTGRRWHEDRGLARAFKKSCQAVGLRYRGPNQCRHTYASWALSAGENPLWVAGQMGHRDTTMIFKRYAKYIPSMNPDAGQKMTKSKAA